MAVTGRPAAQFAAGRPFTALAWLAFAPLLASLLLPPGPTGLLAGWTVLLGLGLALGEGSPAGTLAARLIALVLLASVAATSFRDACAQPGLSLPEVARAVDLSVTRAAGKEDFVTAVLAELDPHGWVQLVVCGHPPPLRLTDADELEPLAPAAFAIPLGMHPDLHPSTFPVRAGDRLLFFTDGRPVITYDGLPGGTLMSFVVIPPPAYGLLVPKTCTWRASSAKHLLRP